MLIITPTTIETITPPTNLQIAISGIVDLNAYTTLKIATGLIIGDDNINEIHTFKGTFFFFNLSAGYLMDKNLKNMANNLNAFFNPMKADLD